MARQVTSVFHSLPSQRVSVGELSHVSLPVRGKDFLLPSILIWHKIVHSISDRNGVVVFCLCESVEKKKTKPFPLLVLIPGSCLVQQALRCELHGCSLSVGQSCTDTLLVVPVQLLSVPPEGAQTPATTTHTVCSPC